MNWFLIALISPITNAFVNHFDKFLLSKYLRGGTVGALILFSSLFAVVALPIIYIIDPAVITAPTAGQMFILLLNGVFLSLAILLYLYALDNDEASYVMPLGQLVPVFGFILAYIILGEVLSKNNIFGGVLIVIGGVVLSLQLGSKDLKIKYKPLLFMAGATFLYALSAVIFKYIALDQGFMSSLFWDMAGKFIFGLILFVSIKSYQSQFITLIKENGVAIFGLNVLNEILGLMAEFALVLAVLYAPVAVVQSVSGLQPVFVLIFGVFITLFFPKFGKEVLERKFLIQKVIGVVVITVGVYFLELFKV